MLEPRFAYRLTQWPELEAHEKSVRVLRVLSRMSLGPVTSGWFLVNSGLDHDGASQLMRRLSDAGAVQRIDFGHGPEGTGPLWQRARAPRTTPFARVLALRAGAAGALLVLALVSSGQTRHDEPQQPAVACRIAAGA
jgi:hypothetical protein